MRVEHVPVEYVHIVWPQVQEWLARSIVGHDEYTVDQMRGYIAAGQWQLLVASEGTQVHGAMVIHIFNRPNQRVAFIKAVGGRGIISKDTFSQLLALVKVRGATTLECGARPSVARLLQRVGMAEKYRILGISL